MLRDKLEEARVNDDLYAKRISNVHIFQPATFAERAVSPKKPILAAGFLFLGLAVGIGVSLLRHASSPYLRTKEDVEFELGVPVISSIPQLPRMESLRLREQKLYRETCQALISEILLSSGRSDQTHARSIAVIGVDVGAGASTLAANLAVSSAVDFQMKTILVDADSRQRSVSKMFGLNGAPGLMELVNGSASHDECLQRTQHAPVEVITAADSCKLLTANPSEIVEALRAYQYYCDLLIVDLAAASQPDQAVALAQHLDGVLVVIESEKTQTMAAERLMRKLYESNTDVIGVVLNRTHSYLPKMIRRFLAPQV
jgi:Mrp family chromosome partitioning ATPase